MPAPRLRFDESFYDRSERDQIEYLMKLCASQNHALDLMQKERDALLVQVAELKAVCEAADQASASQRQVVANLVVKSNEDKEQYAARIQELEADGDQH